MTFKQKLFSTPDVQSALSVALALAAAHAEKVNEFAHLTSPEDYRIAHQMVIEKAESAEEIESAMRQLAALEGDGDAVQLARRRARKLVSDAGRELEAALQPLLDAGDRALKAAQEKAVAAETQFLAGFDCPYEQTGVSRRYAAIGLQLIALREGLDDGQRRSYGRGVFASHLEYFAQP